MTINPNDIIRLFDDDGAYCVVGVSDNKITLLDGRIPFVVPISDIKEILSAEEIADMLLDRMLSD